MLNHSDQSAAEPGKISDALTGIWCKLMRVLFADDLKQEVSVNNLWIYLQLPGCQPYDFNSAVIERFSTLLQKKVWRTHDMSHLLCHNTEHIENTTHNKGEN